MLAQKRQEFFLIVVFSVVFFLITNIVHHLRHVGLAHAEGSVHQLPGKHGPLRPLLMNPLQELALIKRSASETEIVGGKLTSR